MAKRQIIRPPGPEELDQLVKVSAPTAWLAFLFLAFVVTGVVVWSFYSSAPVKINAQGIILSKSGILEVAATSQGQISSVDFNVGDRIHVGDLIAELVQPELAERMITTKRVLDRLRSQKEKISAFQDTSLQSQESQLERNKQSLLSRINTLEETLKINRESTATYDKLLKDGLTTRSQFLAARAEMLDTETQLDDAKRQLIVSQGNREKSGITNARELLTLDLEIAASESELKAQEAEAGRQGNLFSDAEGTIAEISIRPGDIVNVGQGVLRVVSKPSGDIENLLARIYAGSADGKKLKPGMQVQILPATARLERDSYLLGRVISVSPIPSTRESIQATLRNSALVDMLTREGPPFEVVVELLTDPNTPSGFAWSNGRGLDKPVENGTLMSAKIIVDRIPIIALVIPRAETILTMLGFESPKVQ